MTREEIIAANPIASLAVAYGLQLRKSSNGFVVLCPFHKEKSPSCSIDLVKNVFFCHGCHAAGGVIDFVAKMENLTIGQAMRKMGGDPEPQSQWKPLPATLTPPEPESAPQPIQGSKEVAIYSYRDALGVEVFQVLRYEPVGEKKTFRQRHLLNGEWVWDMSGVSRVLYNLPKILKAKSSNIWIVAGEKDADNLGKIGFVATTNVGGEGPGKWLEGYSETLRGKDVILCGDNDPTGEAHVARVLEAIAKEAKTVRVVKIPKPSKDVSDYIALFKDDLEAAAKALFEMSENATVLTGGIEVPVDTMEDLERQYSKTTIDSDTTQFDVSDWLPSLKGKVRPLLPGEVFLIGAATGVGKTNALQCIAVSARDRLPVLMFELELPGPLTFERFAALATGIKAQTVFDEYKAGRKVAWKQTGKLNHITVCSKSGLSPQDIERIIIQTELKTGVRPKLVLIDYHQLLNGQGKSRYERASYNAEQIKIVAKNTQTIIVLSSQIKRKDDDESPEVRLNDMKESGSLEQSCGLAAGLWRDSKDSKKMFLKILKGTKGGTGTVVRCDFDGATSSITEEHPTADVPAPVPPKRIVEAPDEFPEERLPYADA